MTNSISNKTDHKKYPLKLLSAMLVVLMMLSLFVACSDNPDNNGGDNDVTNNSGNTNDSNNENNNNSNDESNNANNNNSANNQETTFSIKYAYPFYDEVTFAKIEETTTINGQSTSEIYEAIIDTTGKIIKKLPTNVNTNLMSKLPYFNGVTYDYDTHTVYNTQYEVIASPDTKGYDFIADNLSGVDYDDNTKYIHNCGFFLVCKTEESFSGDKFYLGVIDSKGEYTIPLSDTHPIATLMAANNASFQYFDISYIGDGYYELGSGDYYNILTNKITPSYPHYEYDYYFEDEYYGFVKIDENGHATKVTASQGELTQVHGDYYLCSSETPSMYNDYTYINVKLIDISANSVLIDFGEYKVCGSDYSVPNSTYYLNGYFLTTVKNAQGSIYCCLFNESGKPVFEPIRLEDNYSDKHYELTDEGFIIKKDDGENTALYFCDYKGNLTALYSIPKDYIHGITLEGFQDGLALIKITENWDSEYKFVNIKGESLY